MEDVGSSKLNPDATSVSSGPLAEPWLLYSKPHPRIFSAFPKVRVQRAFLEAQSHSVQEG